MGQAMSGMNPTMGGLGPLFGNGGINQPGAGAKRWNPVAAPMPVQNPGLSSSPNMTPPNPNQAFSVGSLPPSFYGSSSGGSGSGTANPYDADAAKKQALAMLFKGY